MWTYPSWPIRRPHVRDRVQCCPATVQDGSRLCWLSRLRHASRPTTQTTFEVAGLVLGAAARQLTDYFETCRRKRNVIDYDSAEVTTESQAAELLEKAAQYRKLVEKWIAKHHPKYKA